MVLKAMPGQDGASPEADEGEMMLFHGKSLRKSLMDGLMRPHPDALLAGVGACNDLQQRLVIVVLPCVL